MVPAEDLRRTKDTGPSVSGYDLVLRGGRVVTSTSVIEAEVGITGGRIAAVAKSLPANGGRVLNVGGKLLLPGGIDPHTHIAYGQRPFAQNILSETESMAIGGITTGFSFVGRRDPYSRHLPELIRTLEEQSLLDIGFHPIVGRAEQEAELEQLYADHGVATFKFYPATRGEEIYPEVWGIDDGLFYLALQRIRQMGAPASALVHAENWEMHPYLKEALIRAGRTDQAAYCESRPRFCEEDGILRTLHFAERLDCPTYIVHVSTGEGARQIGEAQRRGVPVIGETCPQYLCFTQDDRFEVIARVNPPLRDRADNEALWQALARGDIRCMGSDHIPNRTKSMATDNVWTTKVGGYPGSGVILPVLMSEGVHRGRIDLPTVARVYSENAARWFGLYPHKGAILPGADADLVVWDPKTEVVYSPEVGHLSSDFSWFTGRTFHGWPSHVLRRGELVVEGNELRAKPGSGRYLRRPLPGA